MTQNAMVTRTQQIILVCTTAAGLALLATGLYLGLDRAEKLASVVSAAAGLGSLAVAAYQITQTRQNGSNREAPRQMQRSGDNSTNIQSGGNITFGDNNKVGGDR
ncbi:hypothetical protein ACIQMV_01775 [Streptomyces sp. NPDC091412]|uniref:hypothetical protein n=1 Tax=Streptomyces sp. NPDC091412 TaxID=3366002 RepID=UPI0038076E80